MSSAPIHIFQKNWAFTSSDSEKTILQTGCFGPCYVVTFTGGKFAAMAHIDDTTQVKSMTKIFEKFRENSLNFNDVKVIVLGGWKQNEESCKWGGKVLKILKSNGFDSVNTNHMHKKEELEPGSEDEFDDDDLANYYYFGAIIDSKTAKTYIKGEIDWELEAAQGKQNEEFSNQYGENPEVELPLTQIFE